MKKALFFFAVMLLASSCVGFLLTEVEDYVGGTETSEGGHDMIVLGDQLEDPYSMENMTKALQSLYGTKADRVVIEPTDIYVRFLPEDEDQFHELEKMGVVMLDRPVDYEIVREGDYYHDPSIEEENITWQYAVVRMGFKFPSGIRHEILDECYLSDNDKSSTKADWIDWSAVEREAYKITGNEKMLVPATKSGSGNPRGRITIYDDKLQETVGVKGVKVSCNAFVKFGSTFTDEEGNYEIPRTFTSDVRYRMVFQNVKGFAIGFNFILVPASVSSFGKSNPSGMDISIDGGSERKLFSRSVVNNAGYEYFKDCGEKGITTPPSNLRIWLFQALNCSSTPMLQQGAVVDNTILSEYLGDYMSLLKMFLPDITLGLKGHDDYCSIYRLAVHEFSHSSHFMEVQKEYWNKYIKFILVSFITSGFTAYGVGTEENHGYCEVGEMWSYYVETMMYRERYHDNTVCFGNSFWFKPSIFIELDDRGLGRKSIFKALTPEVCTKAALQKKLVSLYPEMKTVINQAFE